MDSRLVMETTATASETSGACPASRAKASGRLVEGPETIIVVCGAVKIIYCAAGRGGS